MQMVTYQKMYNILREKILGKVYLPGAKFPTERKLCEEYGVSRITVRHALKLLEEQGFIERMQGRGTFVKAAKPKKTAILDFAYSRSIKTEMPELVRKLLTDEIIIPPSYIAEELGLLKNEKCLFLERLDSFEDLPLTFDQVYIPLEYTKTITPEISARIDFLSIWEERESIKGTFIRETIEAEAANDLVAERLGVSVGSPILMGTEILFNKDETPLAVFISRYRHDRFKMVSSYSR